MKTKHQKPISLLSLLTVVATAILLHVQPAFAQPVAGSVLWLDADDPATLTTSGGAVTAWANKGSDGGSATPTGGSPDLMAGTINGRPAVLFDGVGDSLGGGYTNTGGTLSLYLVLRSVTNPQDKGIMGFYNNPSACNQANFPSNLDLVQDNSQKFDFWRNWFAGGSFIRAQTNFTGQTYVIGIIYDGTSGPATLRIFRPDGTLATDLEQGGSNPNFDVNSFVLGGRQDGCSSVQYGWSGYIAEVIAYNSALNTNDSSTVETYLRAKWQVAGGCLYTLNPPTVTVAPAGTNDSVGVTATDSGCNWTAVSNDGWITVTSGSSGTGNGTVGYTVAANGSASGRTGSITIAGETFTVTQLGTSGGPMTFGFDNGGVLADYGWTNVQTAANQSFTVATQFGGTGGDLSVPQAGTHALFESSFFDRDQPHTTIWARSPQFKLNGSGNMSFYLIGGMGSAAALPTNESQVSANSVPGGFLFAALRNATNGNFVLRANKPGGNPFPSTWQQITFTAAQLAALDQNATYTLDLIDAADGPWGWVAMDSVVIPGTTNLSQAPEQAPTLKIQLSNGSTNSVTQPVSGSVLWLDANDGGTLTTSAGVVSAWANKGSGGGSATQSTVGNRPTLNAGVLNGKPVVRFDGVSQYLEGGYVNSSSNLTLYLVASWITDVQNDGPLSLITAPGSADDDNTGELALLRDDSTKIDAWRGLFGGGTAMRGMPVTVTTPYVIALRYDGTGAGSDIVVSKNGATVPANEKFDFGPPGFTAAFNVNNFTLGARTSPVNTINPWNGDIAELIIYNSALNAADQSTTVNYLKQKWGVTGGNQVRISWPTSATGYTLQRSATVASGYANSGLAVTIEGSDYVAYDNISGAQYYRLIK